MTTASITKSQAKKLYDFCVEHEGKEFFFAKDHGAYFVAQQETTKMVPLKTPFSILKVAIQTRTKIFMNKECISLAAMISNIICR